MEHEILFRGKSEKTHEFVEGYYVEFDSPENLNIIFCKGGSFYRIFPETLERFTGLTDKNGTKIFEGDILQRNNNPKDIVQVVFGKFPVIDMETESAVDEVTGWYCDVIPTDALSRTIPFCLPMPLTEYYIDRCDMEVVGNVHTRRRC